MFNNPIFKPLLPCSGEVYSVAKPYNETQHIGCKMKRVTKYDDSQAEGEYFSLDLNKWSEIENHWIDKNRIGAGRDYGKRETKVFIPNDDKAKIKICEQFILFDRKNWIELRKSRGEDKFKNLKITKEGTIWLGDEYYGRNPKIFIRK
jgi:hypothetical protein